MLPTAIGYGMTMGLLLGFGRRVGLAFGVVFGGAKKLTREKLLRATPSAPAPIINPARDRWEVV